MRVGGHLVYVKLIIIISWPNFGRAVSHLRLFDRERLVRKHQLIFESSTNKNCQRRYRVECASHYRAGGVLSCPHELSGSLIHAGAPEYEPIDRTAVTQNSKQSFEMHI